MITLTQRKTYLHLEGAYDIWSVCLFFFRQAIIFFVQNAECFKLCGCCWFNSWPCWMKKKKKMSQNTIKPGCTCLSPPTVSQHHAACSTHPPQLELFQWSGIPHIQQNHVSFAAIKQPGKNFIWTPLNLYGSREEVISVAVRLVRASKKAAIWQYFTLEGTNSKTVTCMQAFNFKLCHQHFQIQHQQSHRVFQHTMQTLKTTFKRSDKFRKE